MTATTLTRESLLEAATARREADQLQYFGALSPQEAAALLAADPQAHLVDVRTRAELDWVGTPDVAPDQFTHVEWNQYPGGVRNANFLSALEAAVREGQGAQLETWLEEGSVDLALLFRHSPTPKHGDIYLTEAATYLVGRPGDPLLAEPTVPFAAVNDLPLVSFCRPSSWRDWLDHLATQRGISLNVVVEADSLSPA